MKQLLAVALAFFVCLGFPADAFAHMVETNYLLDNQLEFQSTFSTGEPFKEAEVTIYAPNNPDEPWLVTTTDDEGRFAFMPDLSIPGDWDIYIQKEGHEDIWTVPVHDGTIEYNNISDAGSQDIHYASTPAVAVVFGLLAAVAAWLGLTRRGRRSLMDLLQP